MKVLHLQLPDIRGLVEYITDRELSLEVVVSVK